jgi:hypothetical protein
LDYLLKLLTSAEENNEMMNVTDGENEGLKHWIAQMLIRCCQSSSSSSAMNPNCELLLQLGCIHQLSTISKENLQLVYWLCKKTLSSSSTQSSSALAQLDGRDYLKRNLSKIRALLASFRFNSSPLQFTLTKLREIQSLVRLMRLFSLKDEPSLLEDCWKLIKDLVECGQRELGLRSCFLEEFVDYIGYRMVSSSSSSSRGYVLPRLVVKSVPTTLQEKKWNEIPLEMKLSSTSTPSYTFMGSSGMMSPMQGNSPLRLAQDLSPRPPAHQSTSSPRLKAYASSSVPPSGAVSPPRRMSSFGSELFASPPSTSTSTTPMLLQNSSFGMVTQFHLKIEQSILDVLLELFLLFTDLRICDWKTILLFPPIASTESTGGGPDMLTLLNCLAWLRKSLPLDSAIGMDKDKHETKCARLACLVCFSLLQSLKIVKSNPIKQGSKEAEVVDLVKDRLLGRNLPLVEPSRYEIVPSTKQQQPQQQIIPLQQQLMKTNKPSPSTTQKNAKQADRGIVRSFLDKFTKAKSKDFDGQMIDMMEGIGKQLFQLLIPEGQQPQQPFNAVASAKKSSALEQPSNESGGLATIRSKGSRNLLFG